MIGGCEWFCGELAKDQSAPPLLGQVWAHHFKVVHRPLLNIAAFRNHNFQHFFFILNQIAFINSSSS
jgi:hypothetical protein